VTPRHGRRGTRPPGTQTRCLGGGPRAAGPRIAGSAAGRAAERPGAQAHETRFSAKRTPTVGRSDAGRFLRAGVPVRLFFSFAWSSRVVRASGRSAATAVSRLPRRTDDPMQWGFRPAGCGAGEGRDHAHDSALVREHAARIGPGDDWPHATGRGRRSQRRCTTTRTVKSRSSPLAPNDPEREAAADRSMDHHAVVELALAVD